MIYVIHAYLKDHIVQLKQLLQNKLLIGSEGIINICLIYVL